MSEKWQRMSNKNCMNVKKCMPQPIICEQDNPLDPNTKLKHMIQVSKYYVINDNQGNELAVAICPTHLVPIPLELIKRPRQPQAPGGDASKI